MRLAWGVVLSLLAGLALAEEPKEHERFAQTATVNGQRFILLGSGEAPDYEMALYVAEAEARRSFPALAVRAGGRDRGRLVSNDHAQSFVLWGHFAKLAILRFHKELDAEGLAALVRGGLAEELADHSSPELKAQSDQLVAKLDRPLKKGEELRIFTDPEGHIVFTIGEAKREGPQSPKLARALWGLWLGPKVSCPELRAKLVDRVDWLGR